MATTKIIPEVLDLNEAASESGLKIPSGTELNRPATDVAGMVRNNTNEASEGSASCEEYYNGAAWQKINNLAIPPPLAFKTLLYTGNGSTQAITGLGFQPDFVWIKSRSNTYGNRLIDSSTGVDKYLASNSDDAQQGAGGAGLTSFDSDGFSVGSGNAHNANGATFVAWCWKANGGTTSAGSGTGGVSNVTNQVNSDAGFSITKWNEGPSGTSTVTHGLSQAPDLVITKKLNAAQSWMVWHEALSGTQYLRLQETNAVATSSNFFTAVPDSTSVYLGGFQTESTSNTRIMYAFHSVEGLSKFGSYTGTGSAGNAQSIGFQPDFILGKSYDNTEDWFIVDSTRGGNNYLKPNLSNAEATAGASITFTSTGFEFTGGSFNNAGMKFYIYGVFNSINYGNNKNYITGFI